MWRAKEDFLWYKLGNVIPDKEIEEHPNWKEFCEEQLIQGVILPEPKKEVAKVEIVTKKKKFNPFRRK